MRLLSGIALTALGLVLPATPPVAAGIPSVPSKTLSAFANYAEIASLFKKWADEHQCRASEMRARKSEALASAEQSAQPAVPAAAPAEKSADASGRIAEDAVTNVQHAGVDEGGIVKVHGNPHAGEGVRT